MTYFNLASYEKLIEKQAAAVPSVSVEMLADKTDRTLLLGSNSNGSTVHVFIKDGVLQFHEYAELDSENFYSITRISNGHVPMKIARPMVAFPRATDEEFAELMFSFHYGLSFCSFYSPTNQNVEQDESGYFGLTGEVSPAGYPLRSF